MKQLAMTQNYAEIYQAYTSYAEIKRPESFIDDAIAIHSGVVTGTPMLFCKDMAFREGELTIWAGPSGHGKSLITGQQALALCNRGEPTCVMSLEMMPARTLVRMAHQSLTKNCDEDSMDDWSSWLGRNLCLFAKVGTVTPEIVYGAVISACRQFNCKHVFIDNLMKCVAGETGDKALGAQKDFIDTLTALAKDLRCHIHVVHHVRKPEKDGALVDKYSIRGAAAITDLADNIILIQRNAEKEKLREERGTLTPSEDRDEPDTIMTIAKQRNGDLTGHVALWFNRLCDAFSPNADRFLTPLCPIQLIPESQRGVYRCCRNA